MDFLIFLEVHQFFFFSDCRKHDFSSSKSFVSAIFVILVVIAWSNSVFFSGGQWCESASFSFSYSLAEVLVWFSFHQYVMEINLKVIFSSVRIVCYYEYIAFIYMTNIGTFWRWYLQRLQNVRTPTKTWIYNLKANYFTER